MKALVVMPATIEALELCDNLSAQGFSVAHAPSGLYALTLLERDRPDLILAAADVVDMSGRELLEILNEEFHAEVPVILLSDEHPSDLPHNALAVPPGTQLSELLSRAGLLEIEALDDVDHDADHHPAHDADDQLIDPMSTLELDPDDLRTLADLEASLEPPFQTEFSINSPSETVLSSPSHPDPSHPSPAPAPAEAQSGQFRFENQGFIHMVRSLASLSEHARLDVRCGSSSGQLYIAGGQLIHAEFGRQRGEDAVRGLFLAAADHRGGEFMLHAFDAQTAQSVPATIHRPIHQIVLTWSA